MQKVLKKCFEFYVKSSIHVALSVTCLGSLTAALFLDNVAQNMLIFIFSSTLFVYNFTKYFPLVSISSEVRDFSGILIVSILSFLIASLLFFSLNFTSKVFVLIGVVLVIIYTIPLFGETTNWRNKKGWKIYLVALSWIMIIVGVPLANMNSFSFSLFLKWSFIQFIYVWVATLPFEIRDLKTDDLSLQTIPQQLGIYKTRLLGQIILSIGFVFAVFVFPSDALMIVPLFVAFLMLGIGLNYSSKDSSKYFESFWIEGIPIFWWLSFFLISYFY